MPLQGTSNRRGDAVETTASGAMPTDSKGLKSWLESRTVKCDRLGSMIEPSFCKRYRQTSAACRGCEQAEEMDRLAEELELKPGASTTTEKDKMEMAAQKAEPAANNKNKKPRRVCADCGRSMPIVARGLCGKCYRAHSEAGTLDEKFPAKRRGRVKAEEQPAAPSEKVSGEWPGPVAGDDGARNLMLGKVIQQENEDAVELEEREANMPEETRERSVKPLRKSNKNHVAEVAIRFFERDVGLLKELKETAEKNRRAVSAEILCRLDRLAGLEAAQGGPT